MFCPFPPLTFTLDGTVINHRVLSGGSYVLEEISNERTHNAKVGGQNQDEYRKLFLLGMLKDQLVKTVILQQQTEMSEVSLLFCVSTWVPFVI